MAITRLGLCGPSADYPGFVAKASSAAAAADAEYIIEVREDVGTISVRPDIGIINVRPDIGEVDI